MRIGQLRCQGDAGKSIIRVDGEGESLVSRTATFKTAWRELTMVFCLASNRSIILSCLVATVLISPCARAGTRTADEAIAAAVNAEIAAGRFPGAVVMVGTRDQVLYHQAFGLAQIEPEKTPMRKDSIFDMASITKVVCTATAVGICKDRNLIDPDGMLLDYMPDHRGKGVEHISLRHLASHTSGFPDSPRVSRQSTILGLEIFRRMLQDDPSWPVDTRMHYACRNIILLSTIVEKVSGQPFGEFCQKEIFDPLEMREAWFNRIEPSPRVVGTHHPVLGESHNADSRDAGCAIGNAGLFTTARDLANFSEMMLGWGEWRGRRILARATIEDFIRPYRVPELAGRGFVWEVDPKSSHRPKRLGPRAYGHSGNTGTSIWIDPDLGVYVLVLTNRTHPVRHSKTSEQGRQEYLARGRIGDAALSALGY
ncbi:MAG: beta-lactamase family protein [Pirellulaceae bacterium]|nr:beta-lactamase family protein [Pirellulaceae bacterium]